MKLQIRNVVSADFGSYRCVAKNSLGETDGIIKLDGEWTFYCEKKNRVLKYILPEIPMPTSTEGSNISNTDSSTDSISMYSASLIYWRIFKNKLF